jgi:hypothetical protein
MSNDIAELRSALFETLRNLKSGDMDIDRAKAINETAQTIINSTKIEIDHMKVAGGCSPFIIGADDQKLLPGQVKTTRTQGGTKTVTQLPGNSSVTQHRMGG